MAQTIVADEADLGRTRRRSRSRMLRKGLGEWLFLAPALAFFIGYQVWPIVRVLWLSFTDFQFLSDKPAHWIWFDNYVQALRDPLMWTSLGRAAAVHHHVPARNDHLAAAAGDPDRPGGKPTPGHASTA